jgi:23S rRNA (cytidine2498-2'-O)-methyltransferase
MHLFLSAPGMERFLGEELSRSCPTVHLEPVGEGLLAAKGLPDDFRGPVVFGRQCLPRATPIPVPSIRGAAETLATRLIGEIPLEGPWRLHVVARYGVAGSDAGAHRCELIREAVVEQLRKRRRSLLRGLVGRRPEAGSTTPMDVPDTSPFSSDESFVQLLLTSPDSGFVSILPAPGPSASYGWVWPFPRGEVPVAVDKAAPSRAFAKLVESEERLGRRIGSGESCVDLGASPGSWTYVPAMRGARVIAVDRSPLRDDLMRNPRVEFVQGDAFRFVPSATVDWLLCDVIAAPDRSIDLVLEWVRERRCRGFVVTIKFKGDGEYAVLDRLKRELPPLTARFHLLHLCANKNEVCVFGEVLQES